MKKSTSGFTIVELLIVIVVIAILAGIAIVAYTGIQGRAYDGRRISDLKAIAKALEMYKIETGNYPPTATSGLGGQDGWEMSAREATGQFIAPLNNYGFSGNVPVDPINNATQDLYIDSYNTGSFSYFYYRYPPGANGCDPARGHFYVLGALTTASAGTSTHPDSPGFSCSGRNWQGFFSWVTGNYLN